MQGADWKKWNIVMENYKIMNNSIYHYPTINLLDSANVIAQDVDLAQLEEQQKHIIYVMRSSRKVDNFMHKYVKMRMIYHYVFLQWGFE